VPGKGGQGVAVVPAGGVVTVAWTTVVIVGLLVPVPPLVEPEPPLVEPGPPLVEPDPPLFGKTSKVGTRARHDPVMGMRTGVADEPLPDPLRDGPVVGGMG
jgi:hypothetical protein